MKIILAFDKYKGCLSADRLCEVAAEALHSRFGDAVVITSMPMSDGGEGMRTVLDRIYASRTDAPCFVEAAEWCGLAKLPPDRRNPALQSTYPLGQAIARHLKSGARDFVVGLGGSATNDAGTGMLQALGYQFFDHDGVLIEHRLCGQLLSSIASIDGSEALPELKDAVFTSICDVDAPLYGPEGAAFTFAPQKGASPDMVEMLDAGLRSFAQVATDGAADSPGDGAAGGLGFGMRVFLNSRMMPGAKYILEAYGFDLHACDADIIITGEGRSDRQTLMGKVPAAVLAHGRRFGTPVCLVSGAVSDPDSLSKAGFAQIVPVTPPDTPLDTAMRPDIAAGYLRDALLRLNIPH